MEKFIRIVVVIAFLVTSGIFSYVYVERKFLSDKTIPVITMEEDIIDVSMQATDEDYLKGVSAYDDKDGDISDRLVVESIAKFSDKAICKITYAVCDDDNHVTHASRKIHYTDYQSPRFSLSHSLCYSIYENFDISEIVRAYDVIDGDITKNVIITSDNYESGSAGLYNFVARVTNSKGDSVSITLPLVIETTELSAPIINLSKYIVYIDKGQKLDYNTFVSGVTDNYGEEIKNPSIEIEYGSSFNVNKEGVYSVHYYAEDEDGRRGHTILIVVVGS